MNLRVGRMVIGSVQTNCYFVYDEELEQKKAASLKKVKKKWKRVVIIIVIVAAVVAILWPVILLTFAFGLLITGSLFSRVEEYTDISKYETYIGENAEQKFENKWGFEEEIFPETITDDMQVEDFKMVYYNPFDAQYLSYLTVQYDKEDYEAEVNRLKDYESTDYIGNYTVTGPPKGYTLLAMEADDYSGFVYAFTDDEDTIIYVELIFCNYFFDLDYTKYIPEEYLLEGFDATQNNPYLKDMMSRDIPQILQDEELQ